MLKFGEIYVEKSIFIPLKKHIDINQTDINQVDIKHILLSNKYSIRNTCFKYFIGFPNGFMD